MDKRLLLPFLLSCWYLVSVEAGYCRSIDCVVARPYSTCIRWQNGSESCACVGPFNGCRPSYGPFVCGSNGQTFRNACYLRKFSCLTNTSVAVVGEGKCPARPSKDPCKRIRCTIPPYSTCVNVSGLPQCTCVFKCRKQSKPVCASNGITFPNACLLKRYACKTNRGLYVKRNGACEAAPKRQVSKCKSKRCARGRQCKVINGRPQCVCPSKCHDAYLPVCGSDRKTYRNPCELMRKACRCGKTIRLLSDGPCPDPCAQYFCATPPFSTCLVIRGKPQCVCQFNCKDAQDLVCAQAGTDTAARHTYDNLCVMKQAACRRNIPIYRVSKRHCNNPCFVAGRCDKVRPFSKCRPVDGKAKCVCDRRCHKNADPVCGTDGVTYRNECMLKLTACTRNTFIHVFRKGKCSA